MLSKPAPGDVRVPIEFLISVRARQETRYAANTQNELVFKMLSAGIVTAKQAVELMVFDGKDKILKEIREEPMAVIRDIIKGMTGKNSVVIPDRREAIFVAVSMAGRGDILLFAGKGHENYEIVDTGVRPFDEKAIIKEAVRLKMAID